MASANNGTRQEQSAALDLLLMGKSGHGKSSTGNSILGYKEFKALGGGKSVTKTYQVGHIRFGERVIKVVDIPGVCDTDLKSKEDQMNLVVNAISKGLSLFPQGFSALLLVLSYAARITKEELKAIKTLKTLLGKDVLQKHAVCILTHGDSFEADHEEEDMDFQTWLGQQGGELKELSTECEGRVVLFDNRTKDQSLQKRQLNELVAKVDSLKERQTRYTVNNFQAAEKTREEIKREAEILLLVERYSREVGLIKSEMHKIMQYQPDTRDARLNEMKITVQEMINDLSKEKNKKISRVKNELDEILVNVTMFETLIEQQEKEKSKYQEMKMEMEQLREQQRQQRAEQEKMIVDAANKIEERLDPVREEGGFWESIKSGVMGIWDGIKSLFSSN